MTEGTEWYVSFCNVFHHAECVAFPVLSFRISIMVFAFFVHHALLLLNFDILSKCTYAMSHATRRTMQSIRAAHTPQFFFLV